MPRFLRCLAAVLCVAITASAESVACEKLKAEEGLDCASCVDPAFIAQNQEECEWDGNAADVAAEKKALKSDSTLYKETSFLFEDDANVWEVEFTMSKDSWEAMVGDPKLEEYYEGSIKIGGVGEWSGVGIRFKGYVGSLRLCLGGLWNLECQKLSYKIKFNYRDQDQRFFGLKRLQFHASNSDPSMLRERLSYSLYREMGVPAPRQSYSTLRVRFEGEECATPAHILGLHILTEVVDGRFTDMHFDNGGNGNLYKEAWPGVSDAVAQDVYSEVLKTNEEKADVSRLKAWSAALLAAEDDHALAMVMKEFTQAKVWARFLAVDRLIENWDGVTNFRGGPPFWNHNFFIYSEDGDWDKQEFVPIAWDLDGTWPEWSEEELADRIVWDEPVCDGGVDGSFYNGNVWGKAATWPGNDDGCSPCLLHGEGTLSEQGSIACFKVMRAFGRGLRSKYMAAAQELIEGPLRPCRILGKLKRWEAIIKPYLSADKAAGVWPSMLNVGDTYDYQPEEVSSSLINKYVPTWTQLFLESVTCDRGYRADAWGSVFPPENSNDVAPMMDISMIDGMLAEVGPPTWPYTEEYAELNRESCLPDLADPPPPPKETSAAASTLMPTSFWFASFAIAKIALHV